MLPVGYDLTTSNEMMSLKLKTSQECIYKLAFFFFLIKLELIA